MRLATAEHRLKGRTGGAARFGRYLLPAVLFFLALLLPAPPAHSADLLLDEASGHIVEASINGVPLRLKVELDHSHSITINPAAAARAGLGNGQGRWVEIIGPVRLHGRVARPNIFIGDKEFTAPVHWQEQEAVSGADGTITPHLLPFDRVTLQRRPQSAPEQDLVFSSKLHDNHGIHVPVRVGEKRVAVRMSLSRANTSAPAAAAAIIARKHGGVVSEARILEEIAFGVKRPARILRLQQPFQVGGLTIPALLARTADFRGKHKLARAQAPMPEGEILVTGKTHSQPPLYRVTLGLDVLGRCSSATYTRGTGELRLRCAAGSSP